MAGSNANLRLLVHLGSKGAVPNTTTLRSFRRKLLTLISGHQELSPSAIAKNSASVQSVSITHEPYEALRFETGRQRAYPSLQPTLILNLGAPLTVFDVSGQSITVNAGKVFFAGLHDQVCYTASEGLQRGIHVRMSALDSFRAFGPMVAECCNRAVMLEDVEGFGRLQDNVGSEWGLVERLNRAHSVSREIEWVWMQLTTDHTMRIAELTDELGWSRKRLVQRFRDTFGMGPKTVSRLARFDALRQRLKTGNAASWVNHALDVGYFDQPHMIRDVNKFAGLAPAALVAEMRRNNFPIQDAEPVSSNAFSGEC